MEVDECWICFKTELKLNLSKLTPELIKVFYSLSKAALDIQDAELVSLCLKCFQRLSDVAEFQQQCLTAAEKRSQITPIDPKLISSEESIEIIEEWVDETEAERVNEAFCEVLTDSVLPKTRKRTSSSTHSPTSQKKRLKPAAILHKDVNFDPETSCQFCFIKLTTSTTKQEHENTHSSEVQPFTCPICRVRFNQIKHLKQHYLSIHQAAGRFRCNDCGKRFNYAARLKAHEVKHSNPKSFKCDQCNGTFSELAALKIHQKNVHESDGCEYQCDTCNKVFKTKTAIKSHVKIHAVSERKHECQICGKKFLTKEKLLRHSYYHTGNRPYVCDGCNKNYVSAYHLKRHKFYCKFTN